VTMRRLIAAMVAAILLATIAAAARGQEAPLPSWSGTVTPGDPLPPQPTEQDRAQLEVQGPAPGAELGAPWAQAVATDVRAYMRRAGFPVYEHPVWFAPALRSSIYPDLAIAGMATPRGPVVSGESVPPDGRYPEADDDLAYYLVHEYLHSIRDTREYVQLTDGERRVEEGLAAAVTDDMMERFLLTRRGYTPWVTVYGAQADPYSRWAAMVRGVSRRATCKRWDSRPARVWRYRLMRADRVTRAALWQSATTMRCGR